MESKISERLKNGGIDLESGVARVAGNEALFLRLLGKFAVDTSYSQFLRALDAGDLTEAERQLHALKGVSGNLSMTKLYPACIKGDADLKAGCVPENLDEIKNAYMMVTEAISSLSITH